MGWISSCLVFQEKKKEKKSVRENWNLIEITCYIYSDNSKKIAKEKTGERKGERERRVGEGWGFGVERFIDFVGKYVARRFFLDCFDGCFCNVREKEMVWKWCWRRKGWGVCIIISVFFFSNLLGEGRWKVLRKERDGGEKREIL